MRAVSEHDTSQENETLQQQKTKNKQGKKESLT